MIAGEVMTQARILIVDDEQANVRLLERLLMTGGFSNVRSITDPRDALATMDEFEPDLIMLDLNMPHLDGFAVLNRVRARSTPNDYLPILVLTADATIATKQRALACGATDFLTKPFERTEVLLRTRNLVESRYLHLALKNENKVLEAKLVYQTFHDSLTGLANRVLFRDRVEHALARGARGAKSSLLLLDLDNFKSVNDTSGHAEGDCVIQVVADRLLQCTRGCDSVSRVGGDEFAILLDNIQAPDDALHVVTRIMDAMRTPVTLQGREVTVGVSIGVAHGRTEDRVDDLLRNADVAMRKAKGSGKGCHAVFDPAMYTALVERTELEGNLRLALERNEIRVLYQPIVELRSGAITGVEALVRWHRPGHDDAEPAAFIDLAEETGLIVPIGRWVLTEACRQARRWELAATEGAGPTMSVNVSARQLNDPSFTKDVAAVLADTGLSPNRLILEITESTLVSNTTAVDRLHELKALGVLLAIDDFGTGNSNVSYLQRFPLDIIKMDRSFVAKVTGKGKAGLVSIIVDLAKAQNLQTVAQGIEHAEQREQLIALGCTSGQGFLFARPLGADVVTGLVGDGNGRLFETAFGAAAAATN